MGPVACTVLTTNSLREFLVVDEKLTAQQRFTYSGDPRHIRFDPHRNLLFINEIAQIVTAAKEKNEWTSRKWKEMRKQLWILSALQWWTMKLSFFVITIQALYKSLKWNERDISVASHLKCRENQNQTATYQISSPLTLIPHPSPTTPHTPHEEFVIESLFMKFRKMEILI